ncbi:glucosaminidase domain-containing protein [Treponema pectinovorum]|uniref:glucosaminidase domain-containing protein n=1 Tax=Treponema pectinovorum TaxID=164 RepID=UPI003D92D830
MTKNKLRKIRFGIKNKIVSSSILFIEITIVIFSLFSCVSNKNIESEKCSRSILAQGTKTETQLVEFFFSMNPEISLQKIQSLARTYKIESDFEGINSDVAFVQMCLETGFLRFGNLVQENWHNYCGLGAIDENNPGERFETEELGVRAHIQHLQAYATTENENLKGNLVDPRYSWVHKAKFASTIFDLSLSWAADSNYGNKLDLLLQKLEEF